MRKLLIVLLALLWVLLIVKDAGGETRSYSSQFISEVYVPSPIKPLAKVYSSTDDGYCVSFVQANGFSSYSGDAYQWGKYLNSNIGWVGDAVLLNEGPYMHLALVIGTEGGYNLVEQNFLGRGLVSFRTIPFDYPLIIGFISKPLTISSPFSLGGFKD